MLKKDTFMRKIKEKKTEVSIAVVKRLPRYYRYLTELIKQNKLRISSKELSKLMGVTASQIRQDLNCFGGFGQQGYGYNVTYLHGKISELLGTDEGYRAVIVGAGNLGRALASSRMFDKRGISCIALFDTAPNLIGTEFYGKPIYSVDSLKAFCLENNVDIAVLTVPKDAAEEMAHLLSSCVKGIWNFANTELNPSEFPIIIENIHIADSLMTLCYEIRNEHKVEEI